MVIEMSTTCGSKAEAKRIAEQAVTERLCACAHISEVDSVYRWQGAVHNAIEYKVTFKSVEERYSDIVTLIQREHSYDLPAIYATPVVNGTEEYLEWIELNSADPP